MTNVTVRIRPSTSTALVAFLLLLLSIALPVRVSAAGNPGAPKLVNVSGGNGSISVTWSPSPLQADVTTGYLLSATPGGQSVTCWSRAEATTNTCVYVASDNSLTFKYTFTGLVNGTSYIVTVVGVDAQGAISSAVQAAAKPTPSTPSAPLNVSGGGSNGSLTVSWQAPASDGGAPLAKYQVLIPSMSKRYDVSDPNGGLPPTTFTFTHLPSGRTYVVDVLAQNSALQTWGPKAASSPLLVMAIPSTPTAVTVKALERSFLVSWKAPSNAGGANSLSYEADVTYHGQFVTSCTTTTALSCSTPQALLDYTNYDVTVKATNLAGSSLASAKVSGTPVPQPPLAASGVTTSTGSDQLVVSWTDSLNGSVGVCDIAQASVDGAFATVGPSECNAVPAGSCKGVNFTCTILGLSEGQAYKVRVVVIADTGKAKVVNVVPSSVVTQIVGSVPDAVSGLQASPGNGSISLSWSAPASHGFTVDSYQVSYGGKSTVVLGTSTTVTGLTNGTAYSFTVVAQSAAGPSAASQIVATPFTIPNQPTITSISPSGVGSVTVSWSAPWSGGDPAGIAYYVVTNVNNGSSWHATGTSWTVTSLGNGATVTLSVAAVNSAGASTASSRSTTTWTVPNAPANLSWSSTTSTVTISWSAGSSGGTPITSYPLTGGLSASTGSTSFTFTGLPAGSGWDVWVVANNAVGGSAGASVHVSTQSPPPPPTTNVFKGGSFSASWCTGSACQWVGFSLSNFSPNTRYTVHLCDSVDNSCDPGRTGWPALTITTDGSGNFSMTTYDGFGYPNREVWATVVGVSSNENHLTW